MSREVLQKPSSRTKCGDPGFEVLFELDCRAPAVLAVTMPSSRTKCDDPGFEVFFELDCRAPAVLAVTMPSSRTKCGDPVKSRPSSTGLPGAA